MNKNVIKAIQLLKEAHGKIALAEEAVIMGNDKEFVAIGDAGNEIQELIEMIEQGEL